VPRDRSAHAANSRASATPATYSTPAANPSRSQRADRRSIDDNRCGASPPVPPGVSTRVAPTYPTSARGRGRVAGGRPASESANQLSQFCPQPSGDRGVPERARTRTSPAISRGERAFGRPSTAGPGGERAASSHRYALCVGFHASRREQNEGQRLRGDGPRAARFRRRVTRFRHEVTRFRRRASRFRQ
jgi:hypothetical protein